MLKAYVKKYLGGLKFTGRELINREVYFYSWTNKDGEPQDKPVIMVEKESHTYILDYEEFVEEFGQYFEFIFLESQEEYRNENGILSNENGIPKEE